MRRSFFALSVFCALACDGSAVAAPPGFFGAQRQYDATFGAQMLQVLQVWLIIGGYTNGVPTAHFSTRTYKALQQFQSDNGFAPTGRIDKPQIDRLIAIVDQKYAEWGFRKVELSGHTATVWVPFGLGLDTKANASGLHYKDPTGRLSLDFVSLPNRTAKSVYERILNDQRRDGWLIHYPYMNDAEGWFVLSTTAPDGSDHYYRYHQDGGGVTGFALEWDNAAGNVNGERIAVLDSAVLGASMKGEPFIDPPNRPSVEARAEPPAERQPAARPVEPTPTPPPKAGLSTGTGFFVADDGHFLTNAHVVDGCNEIVVKTDDGAVVPAERVATDTTNDLAILKLKAVPKRVVALRIGARLGEGVEAFGFPHSDMLSTSGNFTLGNITALTGMRDDSRYLQMSAPVQAGNSGGPLLDGSATSLVSSPPSSTPKWRWRAMTSHKNVNFAVKFAMVAAPGALADVGDHACAMTRLWVDEADLGTSRLDLPA